jgi:hypothetical protein
MVISPDKTLIYMLPTQSVLPWPISMNRIASLTHSLTNIRLASRTNNIKERRYLQFQEHPQAKYKLQQYNNR